MDNFRSIEIKDLSQNGLKPEPYFLGAISWSVDGSAEFQVEYKITVGDDEESRYLLDLLHKWISRYLFTNLRYEMGRGKKFKLGRFSTGYWGETANI
ncbi:MAG: hypothetical protein KF775_19670 [Cyclobacteriaceae bacterium]|nr:hypothetical protein [Cyclobacteriaceae bacterium]